MNTLRISASSYSNTAPLIWSFLYGSYRGRAEIILDNAPARSAELLRQNRVDAALVPVIAYESIDGARLISGVCVGARERVQSVCLVTRGENLDGVRSVSLDVSSRTSVALTKIIFREFLGFEPRWRDAEPDLSAMLSHSDAALLIGDPALRLSAASTDESSGDGSEFSVFDLVEIWRNHTGLGFVFAMWMTTKDNSPVDFAAARDEGLNHVEEIVENYVPQIGLSRKAMQCYLTESIAYTPDESMLMGMELFFDLAGKHRFSSRLAKPAFI